MFSSEYNKLISTEYIKVLFNSFFRPTLSFCCFWISFPKPPQSIINAFLLGLELDLSEFNNSNIKRVGFSTLKNKFIELEDASDDNSKRELNILKNKILQGTMDWEDVYRKFVSNQSYGSYSEHNISEIPTEKFKSFRMEDLFMLFELSSQIETKIKIYPWEKEILILAGRYSVYLNQDDLKNML